MLDKSKKQNLLMLMIINKPMYLILSDCKSWIYWVGVNTNFTIWHYPHRMNSCQLSHTVLHVYTWIVKHRWNHSNSLIWIDINLYPDCIRRILDIDLDFITNRKQLWEFVKRYNVMNLIIRYAYTVAIVHG